MAEQPDFISQSPKLDPQLPPPYGFTGVDAHIFPLTADRTKLQGICDYFINDVAKANGLPYRIEPLGLDALDEAMVLLDVIKYPKMFSRYPGQEQLGYSKQNEMFVAIPVEYYPNKKVPVPTAVGLFIPFICVDNDWSIITARDVVGIPKVYAEFDFQEVNGKSFPQSVSTRVFETFGSDSASVLKPLLAVGATEPDEEATSAFAPRMAWPYGPLDELYRPIGTNNLRDPGGVVPVSERVYDLLQKSAGVSARSYSLKQFRDAEEPTKADYRCILEGRWILEKFDSVDYYKTDLTLNHYANINLAEALGLQLQTKGLLKPITSINFKGDFGLEIKKSWLSECKAKKASSDQGKDEKCLALAKSSAKLTKRYAKRQLKVAKNITRTALKLKLNPKSYADDVEHACDNAMEYLEGTSKLMIKGIRHIVGG